MSVPLIKTVDLQGLSYLMGKIRAISNCPSETETDLLQRKLIAQGFKKQALELEAQSEAYIQTLSQPENENWLLTIIGSLDNYFRLEANLDSEQFKDIKDLVLEAGTKFKLLVLAILQKIDSSSRDPLIEKSLDSLQANPSALKTNNDEAITKKWNELKAKLVS